MSAKFGPGGNSESFYEKGFRSSLSAPSYVKDIGLDAYEYEAGNGISRNDGVFVSVGKEAEKAGISLSFHAPYFISLSSLDEEKRNNSVEYIKRSAFVSDLMGAKTMVVHCGSCAKTDRKTALGYAEETLEKAAVMMDDCGFSVHLGIETMGKVNQLGTLDEVLTLCRISENFVPVVDFGHLNARNGGDLKTEDDFKKIFDSIDKTLGASYAENLHCHFSKIMFTQMGEKKHLTFEDSVYGPEFMPLAKAIVSLGVSPTIICESAGTQTEDAMTMKMLYEQENKNRNIR